MEGMKINKKINLVSKAGDLSEFFESPPQSCTELLRCLLALLLEKISALLFQQRVDWLTKLLVIRSMFLANHSMVWKTLWNKMA